MRFAAAAVGGVMLAGMLGGFAPESASAEATDVDFARALQYSIYFYDANMCGTDVLENNRYDWRGNCHTYDAEVPLDSTHTNLSESFITQYKAILDPDGDGCVNVEGGFHDAGDHVKFGMPENYAASTLGWGYYEFRDSYVKLGQSSTTLSGGEAQRIKLATELSRRSTGKTVYILDEPTTGLHFADVHKLTEILRRLAADGNTVIVIEHNLDVIKTADYIIDIGPEGGDKGGTVVACGTPEEVAENPNSYTGKYIKMMLDRK